MTQKIGLTVVIPTWNAERTLAATIRALGAGAEVLVADAGSTDATRAIAEVLHARIVAAPKGRGPQIAAGIASASQSWVLILHADTRLQPGWRDAAKAHMADNPGKAAYFRFALDSADPRARRLERVVAWRCRVLGLPYGDQGLLIHRDLLERIGGMRPLPVMEDVDLVCRLGCRRLMAMDAAALTSADKWHREGWLRRSGRNLCCLALWFAGVPPRWIVRLYG
jgi:rSAM/selenodomain-associated transferase 2